MIHDLNMIHFACIAKGTTVLAEFNSKDASLGSIAKECLDRTPSFHAIFTHTVRSKTYTFLIEGAFVYFAIFDEKLDRTEGLAFLKSVRDAFGGVSMDRKRLESLSSHCFQGEFNPVFRNLLGSDLDHMEGIGSPRGQRLGQSENLKSELGSIRGRSKPNGVTGLKKMKDKFLGEFNIEKRNVDKKKENGEDKGHEIGLSNEFSPLRNKSGGLYNGEHLVHHKAKNVWKKQVWIVLTLDLIVCLILFGIWLWVCGGFKCINS